MDCKDLTICDYVKHNGVIKVVDAVYLYSVSVHDPSEEWSISEAKTYPVDDIEPIKLTEDILVKNGFSTGKTISGTELFTCEVTHQLAGDGFEIQRITVYPYSKWICYIETAATIVRTGITYAHQLQHLLRLCGIEKELTI